MSRHGARVLLVVTCLVAGAAVYQSYRFNQSHLVDREHLLAVERETGSLLVTLSDMRAAQMSYLATGQGTEFWMRRAAELVGELQDGITRQRAALESAAGRSALDSALVALSDLIQLDNRARTAIEVEQRYLASDLIFADAVNGTQQVADALRAARQSERENLEATLERERMIELALFPASLVLVLLSAWLAGSSSRPRGAARSEAEEVAQMFRDLPPPVKAPGIPAAPTPPVSTSPVRPAAGSVVSSAPAPAINLTAAAELCVDLARVIDARDMPALLQRAAKTLEASGVIIWVVDTLGQNLSPALSHGYSDKVLARLGSLDVQADNVTSLSFRSMRPQSIPAGEQNGGSSAIAVPLVTMEGCNGVLAAEVPGASPSDDRLAVARILAAQLATMISPLDPPARQAAEA